MRLILAVSLTCLLGCTHMQLKRDVLGQFSTVSELYQKQVLDNLAMFVQDPGAMPYFCVLSTGNNQVTDMGSAMNSLTFARAVKNLFMVTQDGTTLGLSRSINESWGVNAVSDPRRLELMRCAYQKEVAAYFSGPGASNAVSQECPNCKTRWDIFYGGPDSDRPDKSGRVTSACLGTHSPWFCCGRKCDVPKSCDCLSVGHYCGAYVWVLPDGRDELTKLTLAILDYATNQPAVLTKDVTYNIDNCGKPTDSKNATGSVRVTVPYNVRNSDVLASANGARDVRSRLLGVETHASEMPTPPEIFQNTQPPDFQYFNQRLQMLNPPR